MSGVRALFGLVALGAGAACHSPTDVGAPSMPSRRNAVAIHCAVTVQGTAQIHCAPASIQRAHIATDVILGRKNYDVTVNFSNVTYSSVTGVFSAGASLTNLLNQPMGTTDGTTASPNGTRIFFTILPGVTFGSGTITLTNPDGIGTFTASNQPYFQYSGIIEPSDTTTTKTWNFQLSSGVTGFAFTVEIDTPLPAEASIRHWAVLRQGLQSNPLTAVWQQSPTNVWAVGANNTILQNTGSGWAIITPTGYTGSFGFQAIYGTSATDYWAVASGGQGVHYNGSTWTSSTFPSTRNLHGVWGAATNRYFAVGDTMTLDQYTALLGWRIMVPPIGVNGNIILRGVWGADSTHVFAVGDGGTILNWNGLLWIGMTSPTTQNLLAVWGTSATNVFAVGANGTILQYNGTAWSAMTSPTTNQLNAVGGSGSTDIWAVGAAGTTVHYNGIAWTATTSVTGISLAGVVSGQAGQSPLYAVGDLGALMTYSSGAWALSNQSGIPINAIWADSPTDVWAASYGTALNYNGSTWTSAYVGVPESTNGLWGLTPGPTLYAAGAAGDMSIYSNGTWTVTATTQSGYNAAWGSAANNVYAVGAFGDLTRYNGTQWVNQTALTSANLYGLWGTSASNIYAVGASGQVFQFNGGLWSSVTTTGTTAQLLAVGGSSATDVWIAGAAGTMLQYNGTTWSAPSSGTTVTLRAILENVPTGSYTADVYAAGDNGTVVHGNGSEFLPMPTPVTTSLDAVFATSSTNIYVGGANGVVLVGTQ